MFSLWHRSVLVVVLLMVALAAVELMLDHAQRLELEDASTNAADRALFAEQYDADANAHAHADADAYARSRSPLPSHLPSTFRQRRQQRTAAAAAADTDTVTDTDTDTPEAIPGSLYPETPVISEIDGLDYYLMVYRGRQWPFCQGPGAYPIFSLAPFEDEYGNCIPYTLPYDDSAVGSATLRYCIAYNDPNGSGMVVNFSLELYRGLGCNNPDFFHYYAKGALALPGDDGQFCFGGFLHAIHVNSSRSHRSGRPHHSGEPVDDESYAAIMRCPPGYQETP